MSDREDERCVKARHDLDSSGQHYRGTYKRTMSKKKLPRAYLTIDGAQNSSRQEESSDEDVEDETYVPSPKAPHRSKGKGLASGSRSGAARNAEESGDEEEELFDVEEIVPRAYVHMGTPSFRQPQNHSWREKVNYMGKTKTVRDERRVNPRLHTIDITDYRFHTFFQQDFYKSVILIKLKPVAISQWIDWNYMENKNATIFNEVVAASKVKHLRDVMAFQKKMK
jgi:hypothetical protein